MPENSQPSTKQKVSDNKTSIDESQIPMIGELLIAAGHIDHEKLEAALEEQKTQEEYLGVILMRHNKVTEKGLFTMLSRQKGIPFYENLSDKDIPTEVIDLLPRDLALKHSILPLELTEGELTVGMENPYDENLLDIIGQYTRHKIKAVFATRSDLHYSINRVYNSIVRSNDLIREFFDGFSFIMQQDDFDAIKAIDIIFAAAHLLGATSVILRFTENEMHISMRIDGMLHEIPLPKRRLATKHIDALTYAVESRAGIEFDEDSISQQGRLELTLEDKSIGASVSCLKSVNGQRIVLELDRAFQVRKFEDLGFSDFHYGLISDFLDKPTGLSLISGDAHCGRSTTIYALLGKLSSQNLSIVTIEDPVKSILHFASQVEIKKNSELNCASVLRSIVSHESDVLYINELNDRETATLAVDRTLTGDAVLSRIKSQDAVETIISMLGLGVEPIKLSSALRVIIAQRLVPRVCNHCRRELMDSRSYANEFGLSDDSVLYWGTGCEKCYFTGRRHQIALFELLECDDQIRDIIAFGPSKRAIREYLNSIGWRSFRDDAIEKCKLGLISPIDISHLV